MSEYFQLNPSLKWSIKPGQTVIKASDYALLSDSNRILSQVKEIADATEKKSQALYKQRYKEGYELGIEEGKALYTDKLMDMVMGQVDSIEGLENQLVDVVMESLNKILGSFDQRDLVTMVVHQGLNAVRGSKSIVMRVSSQDEKILRETLRNYLISRENASGYINLITDPNLKVGDCIIETDQGVINASLSSQLKILEKSLINHIKRK